jgi:hypothetical protein
LCSLADQLANSSAIVAAEAEHPTLGWLAFCLDVPTPNVGGG